MTTDSLIEKLKILRFSHEQVVESDYYCGAYNDGIDAAIKILGDASTRKDEERELESHTLVNLPELPSTDDSCEISDIAGMHSKISEIISPGQIYDADPLAAKVMEYIKPYLRTTEPDRESLKRNQEIFDMGAAHKPVSVDLNAGARAIRGFQEMIGYDDLRMAKACAEAWGLKYD